MYIHGLQVRTITYVCGLQVGTVGTYVDCRWAQLFMHACCSGKSCVYAGCSGAKRVCTRVAIRRIIYIVF
jgi:hypothetical protein